MNPSTITLKRDGKASYAILRDGNHVADIFPTATWSHWIAEDTKLNELARSTSLKAVIRAARRALV